MAPHDIYCPYCKKPDTWHENNPFRPFCSERCKMIDLGAWAEEKHVISDNKDPEDTYH